VVAEVQGNGSKTVSALMDELFAKVQARGGLKDGRVYTLYRLYATGTVDRLPLVTSLKNNAAVTGYQFSSSFKTVNDYIQLETYILKSSGSTFTVTLSNNTSTDSSADALTATEKLWISEREVSETDPEIIAEITADGVKNWRTICQELYAQIEAAGGLNADESYSLIIDWSADVHVPFECVLFNTSSTPSYQFYIDTAGSANNRSSGVFIVSPDSSAGYKGWSQSTGNPTYTDYSTDAAYTGVGIRVVRHVGGSGDGGVSSETIGNLEDLTTTDKSNIVAAINEVKDIKVTNTSVTILSKAEAGATYSEALNSFNSVLQNLSSDQLASCFIRDGDAAILSFSSVNRSTNAYAFVGYATTDTDSIILKAQSKPSESWYMLNDINKNTSSDISDISSPNGELQLCLKGNVADGSYKVIAEVTGDGSMTVKDALNSLYAQIMANGGINPMEQYALLIYSSDNDNYDIISFMWDNFPHDDHEIVFAYTYRDENNLKESIYSLRSSNSQSVHINSNDSTNAIDSSNSVVPTSRTYKVIRYGGSSSHKVLGTVTSDGVKTWAALFKDLWDACQANGGFSANKKYELRIWFSATTDYYTLHQAFFANDSISFTNSSTNLNSTDHYYTVNTIQISSTAAKNIWEAIDQKTNGQTYSNNSNNVQVAGTRLEIIEV
jgi:hypothetical protein